jgi:hypothetical protein
MERGLEFHAQTKFKETTFMGRSSFHIMQNDEVEKAVHIPLKQSINQIKRKGHRNCTYRVHAPYVQQYFCNLSSCSSLYIYIYIYIERERERERERESQLQDSPSHAPLHVHPNY